MHHHRTLPADLTHLPQRHLAGEARYALPPRQQPFQRRPRGTRQHEEQRHGDEQDARRGQAGNPAEPFPEGANPQGDQLPALARFQDLRAGEGRHRTQQEQREKDEEREIRGQDGGCQQFQKRDDLQEKKSRGRVAVNTFTMATKNTMWTVARRKSRRCTGSRPDKTDVEQGDRRHPA